MRKRKRSEGRGACSSSFGYFSKCQKINRGLNDFTEKKLHNYIGNKIIKINFDIF